MQYFVVATRVTCLWIELYINHLFKGKGNLSVRKFTLERMGPVSRPFSPLHSCHFARSDYDRRLIIELIVSLSPACLTTPLYLAVNYRRNRHIPSLTQHILGMTAAVRTIAAYCLLSVKRVNMQPFPFSPMSTGPCSQQLFSIVIPGWIWSFSNKKTERDNAKSTTDLRKRIAIMYLNINSLS